MQLRNINGFQVKFVKMIASDHHRVKLGVKLGYICDLRIINQGY